jgi:enoyl-CoA hydratase
VADSDRTYDDFGGLSVDRPADGVVRITLDGPGLNAVDTAVHRQLADIWPAVDRDPRRASPCCAVRGAASRPVGASS